jgi:hypothetical protein
MGVACAELAAEVGSLKEMLKGTVPLAELTARLHERDAQHDLDTKDLRVQAHKVAGLQDEVDRLKEQGKTLAQQLIEDTKWLEDNYQAERRCF